MPKCLNDESRSYKGNEPSPKGYGYCAHAEPLGETRTGQDGNIWVVESTRTGVKRWVKKTSSSTSRRSSKRRSSKRRSSKRRSSRRRSSKK